MKKGILLLLSMAGGVVIGTTGVMRAMIKTINEKRDMSDKHFSLFLMMNQWVKLKQKGENLSAYFEANGYKRIAIYGMSYAGVTLVEELRGTNIKVVYGIDNNIKNNLSDVHIVSVDEDLENVDVVVVTAITFFNEIVKSLNLKIKCPIVSLEEVLCSCMLMENT